MYIKAKGSGDQFTNGKIVPLSIENARDKFKKSYPSKSL